jgi:hypothetical protein
MKVPLSAASDAGKAPVGLAGYPMGPSPLQAGLSFNCSVFLHVSMQVV